MRGRSQGDDGEALIVRFGGGIKRGRQRAIDQARALLPEYEVRKKAGVLQPSANQRKRRVSWH